MTSAAYAQSKTGTEVPGGAAKAPFPPFNQDTFGSQLFWLVICFVVLYVLLSRWALPRLASIFAARQGRVEGDLEAAKRLTAESEAAIEAYEKALADARAKAQAIAGETRAEFSAKSDETKRRLEAELAAKLSEAERQIETTKKSAMANVRGIAADAAGEIVKRLIGEAPTKQSLERAVDTALH
ncbi:MAG TPA: F0F1 ATP synthase subunit B' [Xanthobacteraceae bacterium]|nr:F0F1 ATP synthase subunit B' [Xanthobacteraceae bacterium]